MNTVKHFETSLMQRYPVLAAVKADLRRAYDIVCECQNNGGKILVCGNGGSAADSEHIVGELMKGFLLKRGLSAEDSALFADLDNGAYLASKLQGAIPAVSLTSQTGLLTAFSNDVAADMAFAQQVWAYARSSPDVVIALSTSGNSGSVVNAVRTANALGRKSIGITGLEESSLSREATVCIRVPETETYKVQELTMPVYHTLCAMAEATFFLSADAQ